ncbi:MULTISPECIES: hypothetical protein [Legionella]|uniref:Uncharacterized protein n=1 Tax=Legionella septentrionalis TaxID=2498109 RepID=A0A3S0VBR2_9GAMM|nr:MULTISPECIES: hypothetical protein [Legionella]MCP0914106.1 hypothetical protein [Legionella sp. 27cVA30]RUQ90736.1 hypothetical protein EKM59_01315 [Legionella septentrionalis]RUQ99958.1 hypothetical protein ELY11_03690 [Legionella septentrionalis]RUR10197.1 hypothetical protein ELY14_05910 [Legionella septentrionalis]RUR15791.1 hypothetical protein ELY10_05035 [Legionella septentrionalis]
MSETIEDLTIAFNEDGMDTVKELDKYVLSKGAWTTILFRYQEWDRTAQEYGPVKYSIRRYQKRNNQYWQKSKFNISSEEQARKIISVLSDWLNKDGA